MRLGKTWSLKLRGRPKKLMAHSPVGVGSVGEFCVWLERSSPITEETSKRDNCTVEECIGWSRERMEWSWCRIKNPMATQYKRQPIAERNKRKIRKPYLLRLLVLGPLMADNCWFLVLLSRSECISSLPLTVGIQGSASDRIIHKEIRTVCYDSCDPILPRFRVFHMRSTRIKFYTLARRAQRVHLTKQTNGGSDYCSSAYYSNHCSTSLLSWTFLDASYQLSLARGCCSLIATLNGDFRHFDIIDY